MTMFCAISLVIIHSSIRKISPDYNMGNANIGPRIIKYIILHSKRHKQFVRRGGAPSQDSLSFRREGIVLGAPCAARCRPLLPRAAAPGGRGGDRSPANVSAYYIMPMGGAWKESTSKVPRPPPPNRRAVAPPLSTTYWTEHDDLDPIRFTVCRFHLPF